MSAAGDWDGHERRTSPPITIREFNRHVEAEQRAYAEVAAKIDGIESMAAGMRSTQAEILSQQRCVRETWDKFQSENSAMLKSLREADLPSLIGRIEEHLAVWCYAATIIRKTINFVVAWTKKLLPVVLFATALGGAIEIGNRLGWW